MNKLTECLATGACSWCLESNERLLLFLQLLHINLLLKLPALGLEKLASSILQWLARVLNLTVLHLAAYTFRY